MKVLNHILSFIEQEVQGRVEKPERDHPEPSFEWQDGRCLPCLMQIMHNPVYNANSVKFSLIMQIIY